MQISTGSFGVWNKGEWGDIPLKLYDGGFEHRVLEKYDFDNRCRPDFGGYLFQCTLEGEGLFERNENIYHMTPGTGFLVKLPEHSRYWLEDERKGWRLGYLHFDGSAVEPFFTRIMELCNGVFRLREESRVIQALETMRRRIVLGSPLQKYEGGRLLYDFLCILLEEIENPYCAGEGKSDYVNQAIQIMERDYANLSGVAELADRVGVSWEHFSRSFHHRMGCTPIKYLTDIRIQVSMNLLLNTHDNLNEIAELCGFTNGNYFNKVFRKNTGITPSQYRRKREIS